MLDNEYLIDTKIRNEAEEIKRKIDYEVGSIIAILTIISIIIDLVKLFKACGNTNTTFIFIGNNSLIKYRVRQAIKNHTNLSIRQIMVVEKHITNRILNIMKEDVNNLIKEVDTLV